jgi:hypothetical protein
MPLYSNTYNTLIFAYPLSLVFSFLGSPLCFFSVFHFLCPSTFIFTFSLYLFPRVVFSSSLLLLKTFLQFFPSPIPRLSISLFLFPSSLLLRDFPVLELFLNGFVPSSDVLLSSLSLLLLCFLTFGDFGKPSLSCPLPPFTRSSLITLVISGHNN